MSEYLEVKDANNITRRLAGRYEGDLFVPQRDMVITDVPIAIPVDIQYQDLASPLPVTTGTRAETSLDAVTATGAGALVDLESARASHALQVTHTGSPTAVVVKLMGSLDGTTFTEIGEWDSATEANGATVFVTGKPSVFVRADLGTLTGGATPTVTAICAAV
jgi:hypothetical protein